ncbi:MAG: DUF1501 domain-containing protein [Planctomycetes bacterium]|nr:DUF1501 domain-containing protein [Planctomycetota bacterium]
MSTTRLSISVHSKRLKTDRLEAGPTRAPGCTPSRRNLLRAGAAGVLLPSAVSFGRPTGARERTDRTLVLLHLSGGNDGLNTIVPYADPLYHELRPRLSSVAPYVLAIDGRWGFHPALAGLARLFDQGRLAVVHGVGHPAPDYSHVGSCHMWATGNGAAGADRGWWDDVVERVAPVAGRPVVCVGRPPVATMVSPRLCRIAGGLTSPRRGPVAYRPGAIAATLATAARVILSPQPPPIVLATVGGFDTHEDQLARHATVLRELGDGLAEFHHELEVRGAADRVVLMAWSEFGRRPAENATGGTDHGSAGPVLLLGRPVRGGLYATPPSLHATDFGNLIPTVDFRIVYQGLARWLGCREGTSRDLDPLPAAETCQSPPWSSGTVSAYSPETRIWA